MDTSWRTSHTKRGRRHAETLHIKNINQSRRAHSIDSELRLITHTESEIASCISISTQEPSEKMISPSNLVPNQASEVTKGYDGEKASSPVTVGITAASALKALELYTL